MKKSAVALILALTLGFTGCSNTTSSNPQPLPTETTQIPQLKPAEITDYSILPTGGSLVYFSALIVNPNNSQTLFDIEVEVLGIGKNDVVLDSQIFSIGSLMPNETWVLAEPFVEGVLEAEFEISEATLDEDRIPSRLPDNSISGIETEYSLSDTQGVYTGFVSTNAVVSVPNNPPFNVVILCAAYYDQKKTFLGGDCEGKEVFAGRKNGIEIEGFIKPKYPADVKVYARYGT